jgi:outer membrane biosynthesis protein TonB
MAIPNFKSTKEEEDNNQKGTLTSLSLHVLVLLAMYLMPAGGQVYKENKAKIEVELPQDLLGGGPALGLPNQGSGDNPAPGKPDPDAGNSGKSKPEPAPEAEPKPAPPPKPVFSKPTPAPTPPKKVETTEDPNAAVVRRQQEETRKKAEEERYRQQSEARAKQEAENAKRRAEEEDRRAAAEEAARKQAAKDKFGGKFGQGTGSGTNGGGGTGTGRGNTGTPGNQGKPDGDPNSKVLEGMGRGAGTVNGFGGRGVRSAPRLTEGSEIPGKILLDVCVDGEGDVVSAKYTARGSTLTDNSIIEVAIRNAKQYKFAPGSVDKQCGTITYNFIVR